MPASSAASWMRWSGTPAWTVIVAAVVSTSSIARIRSIESATQPLTGVPPPARPLRPPCGTTTWRCAWQIFMMAETSWVERG